MRMYRKSIQTLILVGLLSAAGRSGAADYNELIDSTHIRGGLIAVLGAENPEAVADLPAREHLRIMVFDEDPERVEAVRSALFAKGKYGPITAHVLHDNRLPFVDNLVNTVVSSGGCRELDPRTCFGVSDEEQHRVLAPGGSRISLDTRHHRLDTVIKPRPSGFDDWPHFLYGPDNNARSSDTVAGAPGSLQWTAGPRWQRMHETQSSISACVVADGRIFAIVDEGPLESIRYPSEWKLVARDAFNGQLLWKRDIEEWVDRLRYFRSGPAHLPRRLVAIGDKVYITLGIAAPVSVLDAATGKTIGALPESAKTEEILVGDDAIYLVAGPSEVFLDKMKTPPDMQDVERRKILVLTHDGEKRWEKIFPPDNPILPLSLTVHSNNIYYQDLQHIVALNRQTGEERWRAPHPSIAHRMAWSGPTIVATDEVLLHGDRVVKSGDAAYAPAEDRIQWRIHSHGGHGDYVWLNADNALTAYDTSTGEKSWSIDLHEGYNSAPDILVFGEWAFIHMGIGPKKTKWNKQRREYRLVHIKTGEVKQLPEGVTRGLDSGGHHRCYRNRAAGNKAFIGEAGVNTVNIKTGNIDIVSWIRGACQFGVVPANGMIYAPPHPCACAQLVKLNGFIAAVPRRPIVAPPADPLIKGPVYDGGRRTEDGRQRTEDGKAAASQSSNHQSSIINHQSLDWPMHRANAKRSSYVNTAGPEALDRRWSAKLPGEATQPVVVGDMALVAVPKVHSVYALSTADGSVRWRYTADARIDSSPSWHRGTVIFGSADGSVTCLRAEDGKTAWRFRAAPEPRMIMTEGRCESAWPSSGSALVQGDAVYFAVGRNTFLDDGIHLYKLDPRTGYVLAKRQLINIDPETGEGLGETGSLDMEGSQVDLISGDGLNIFMKHRCFDENLKPLETRVPHLVAIHGFLEKERFSRSYWYIGTGTSSGWGSWHSITKSAPYGRMLCFDDANIFGYGRKAISGSEQSPVEDKNRLFSVELVMRPTLGFLERNRLMEEARERGERINWRTRKTPPPPTLRWATEDSLIVKAMALAGNRLYVAGAVDKSEREQTFREVFFKDEEKALKSRVGGFGVKLQAVDPDTGAITAEVDLEALPVHDGLSVAQECVFISLENHTVECRGTTK